MKTISRLIENGSITTTGRRATRSDRELVRRASSVGRRLVPSRSLVALVLLLLAGLLVGAIALCGLVSVTGVPTLHPIADDLWARRNHDADVNVNGPEVWRDLSCCKEDQ